MNVPGVPGGSSSMQLPSKKIYLTAIVIFFFLNDTINNNTPSPSARARDEREYQMRQCLRAQHMPAAHDDSVSQDS